jgi:hypothetical protein
MKQGSFHPGLFPISSSTRKRKPKPKQCHVKSKARLPSLNILFPIDSIEAPYRMEFLMQKFSVSNTFRNNAGNQQLLMLYQNTPMLQPYIQSLKDSFQRRGLWMFRNQSLRTAFKRLAQLWLYKRYRGRYLNTVDVATLEEPKKAISVYDSKAKGMYTFEATTLKRCIDSDLSFTSWLFPEPHIPRNTWTNCAFTIPQLLTIQRGLYRYEMTSVFLEIFKKSRWNLALYLEMYTIPIKLEGLRNMIQNTTSDEYITLISEFIEDEHDYHDIEYVSHLTILKWAVSHCTKDAYMLEWVRVFEEYTRICIYNSGRGLDRADTLFDSIHDDTQVLFQRTREIARLGRQRLYETIR